MNIRLLRKRREPPPHPLLRLIRIAAGAGLILLGIIMLLTPGQGILTILFGLWVMSADVRLARRALWRLRIIARRARRKYRAYRAKGGAGTPGAGA